MTPILARCSGPFTSSVERLMLCRRCVMSWMLSSAPTQTARSVCDRLARDGAECIPRLTLYQRRGKETLRLHPPASTTREDDGTWDRIRRAYPHGRGFLSGRSHHLLLMPGHYPPATRLCTGKPRTTGCPSAGWMGNLMTFLQPRGDRLREDQGAASAKS